MNSVDDGGDTVDPGRAGEDLVSRELFARSPVAMVVADAAGRLVEMNGAAAAFIDRSPFSTAPELRDVTDPRDAGALATQLALLADGPSSSLHFDLRFTRPDGPPIWGRVNALAIRRADGSVARILAQIEPTPVSVPAEDPSEYRAFHDELTELANPRLFAARLDAALTDRRSDRGSVAVVVIDFDRFTQINDGIGHAAGDLILIEAGRRLMEDTDPRDTVARLGPDEYGVVAPDTLTADDAIGLAGRLCRHLRTPFWIGGNPIYVGASVGAAWKPADGQDASGFVREARSALTTSKRSASGWIVELDGANQASSEARSLARDLPAAIERGEISLAYQPVVDHAGLVHNVEAFARWSHPQHGVVPPDQFIALAEQTGLTATLSHHILHSAATQAARWADQGVPVRVAVNFSAKQLGEPHLVWTINETLEQVGIAADLLSLDVTEASIVRGGGYEASVALDLLRRRGVRVSIDDFGTGYSSVAYLKSLPLDGLKIDRSFVSELAGNQRAARVVRAIIQLGHSLDLVVVAEGVEDEATALSLRALGCDQVQGYGVLPPSSAEKISEWLTTRSVALTGARPESCEIRHLRILVVDDDKTIRALLRAVLSERGHDVTVASGGREAVSLASSTRPDLVILDHRMPDLNGIETLPFLRAAGVSGPVILYTGTRPSELASMRFPLDVWPVSKADQETLLALVDGHASHPSPHQTR